ncbi:intracellular short-chain-length polyhydroxyalkanoate depolymerase [Ureibacillus manganicus]|uniref:3-oxoadipate enol-lactonase n=1 Tax=Ureibacillus manganicus DSM 26584 TaxID=1384049 RepID=A0A0A3I9N0_9BACL|nr:alpha/beta hydrolase [Ureibacillus manganicus]KGR79498.1 3-oxoadipate enol-lactonase [Ureibacillus manganicus DSM 26584]
MNMIDQLKAVELSNGETITYRERLGGDKLVLFIHGNMTSSKHWDILMEAFSDDFTIIAPDLRGFGGSTYNKRASHVRDFSNDIRLFVDALELKKFSLVGWSFGGTVCMQFCIDNPEYCEKLVLLASGSTRGYPHFKTNSDGSPDVSKRFTTIEEIESDPMRTIPMQGLYDTKNKEGLKMVWNAAIYTHNQPVEEKYNEYIEDMLTQRNLADVYHALNTFNISHFDNVAAKGTGEVDNINVPVLNLYGDRDLVVPMIMTQQIIDDLGDKAENVQLVNCGHSPLIDDLERLKLEIEKFLE